MNRPTTRPQIPEAQRSEQGNHNHVLGRRPSAPGSSAANRANFGRNQASHRVDRNITTRSPALLGRPRTRSISRLLEESRAKDSNPSAKSIQIGDIDNPVDAVSPNRWQPSISIGSPLWLEGEDPSRIEIADRDIAQKRLWVQQYQGVPEFAGMLDEAINERRQLDENDVVNTIPRHVLHAQPSRVNQ